MSGPQPRVDQAKAPRRECRLCGWTYEAFVVHQVPLASPPQDNAICRDCAEEVADLFAALRGET